ncbi:type I polyketide synthase [Mycolicibacterium bacteremicum]|uniref:type I polyketide synthase n=1 Tax=Mycolicibacterium bacteremicum TaxID=564198 RepID=UPI0026F062AA|nr:type I polyketide synthase [Mycolicibacterium bacteremicum]
MTEASPNPLVVVGLACQFPGGAEGLDAYWALLEGGVDATSEIPPDRWNAEQYYASEAAAGKMTTRRGGFLRDVCGFDAAFFGISEAEARSMDPQHRLLLETSWSALEDAGIAPMSLRGSRTGVFFGPAQNEYLAPNFRRAGFGGVNGLFCMAAGRVAHFLDLAGPTLALDTACSSSLVALHTACQSLAIGECELAIVAASQAIVNPIQHLMLSEINVLSPDGRCKTFAEDANGFARAEGCGALIVTTAATAAAMRLTPRAVIRATAINHDGHTPALIAPSASAQFGVLEAALRSAAISAEDITFVETHGTGTPVGDPKEVEGIMRAFGSRRGDRVTLGAVKTNLGHLEQAAGMAALVKTILSLQRSEIAPNLAPRRLNPALNLADSAARIPVQRVPWRSSATGRRVAGVSGFGFSGTNAHVLLEQADTVAPPATELLPRTHQLLCLSAKTHSALAGLARNVERHLLTTPSVTLADACYTLGVGRTPFDHRAAVTCTSTVATREALRAIAGGDEHEDAVIGRRTGAPRIVFLYSGQGSQTPGMGRALYEAEPVFRAALDRCDEVLGRQLGEHTLLEVMFTGGEVIHETRYAQPSLFAFQYALTELLASWGIAPAAVAGHSVGEYAAACTAGVLPLDDSLWLLNERSRHMASARRGGAMVAFSASADQLAEFVADHATSVSIGAVNGPRSTVLSGDADAIERIAAETARRGIRGTALTVSHAFHSPHMDDVLDGFEQRAARLAYGPPRIPLMSNVTGAAAEAKTFNARYFRDHIRQPVQFGPGIEALAAADYSIFVEIGPHPVLCPMAAQIVGDGHFIALQSRGRDSAEMITRGVAALHTLGAEVEWPAFYAGREQRRVPLPTMPFEHKRYWVDDQTPMWSEQADSPALRPLAQRRSAAAPDPDQFTSDIDFHRYGYLSDHRVAGLPVFPAAGYIEMMFEALSCAYPQLDLDLSGATFERAAVLPEDGARQFSTRIEVDEDGSYRVEVFGRAAPSGNTDDSWQRHASAAAIPATRSDTTGHTPLTGDRWRTKFTTQIDVDAYYADLHAEGLDYGPLFRGVQKLWLAESEPAQAIAEVALPLDNDVEGYTVHPALLDACLHAIGSAQRGLDVAAGMFLPVGVDQIRLGRPAGDDSAAPGQPTTLPGQVLCHVRVDATSSPDVVTADVDIVARGALVLHLVGLRLQRTEGSALRRLTQSDISSAFVVPSWERSAAPVSTDVDAVAGQAWLVLGDGKSLTETVVKTLRARGANAFVLTSDGQAETDGDSQVVDPRTVSTVAAAIRTFTERAGRIDRVLCLWPSAVPTQLSGLDSGGADTVMAVLEFGCGGVLHTVQALTADTAPPPALTVVTRGAHRVVDGDHGAPLQASVWGLARVVSVEHPELRCTVVDLDPIGDIAADTDQLLAAGDAHDPEWQVAFRGRDRFVFRLGGQPAGSAALTVPAAEGYALTSHRPGVLDELALDPYPVPAPGPDEVQVRVDAASINFRDVMNALGVYPGDPEPLGQECAGTITAVGSAVHDLHPGDEVIARAPGAFRSIANAKASRTVRRPRTLAAAHAAAVPVAFLTADHALQNLAALQPGETVLVHAAAGGVGLAALQWAQMLGADVIATAGSPRKRELLRQLGIRHVLDSRSLDFEHEVMSLTGGRGVDVVLNSLANDFVAATLRTLRPGGRFVEIGKVTVLTPEQVPAGIRYFHFDLNDVPDDQSRAMLDAILDKIGQGSFQPLPVQTFDASDAVSAFRTMSAGRHIGKLALRFGCHADADAGGTDGSYLVTGGLGGLGVRIAQALLEDGAATVVLTGRRAPDAGTQRRLREMDPTGQRIVVMVGDVAAADDVHRILADIAGGHPPLRGIVHAAGVIDDALIAAQTWDSMQRVLTAKVLGAYHLHLATAGRPLDFFVLFSSMTSVLGTAGQANYAAGNAFMDGLANYRRSLGMPALSINWGAFSEVGMAARESGRLLATMQSRGMDPITPDEGAQAFTTLTSGHLSQVAVLPTNWAKYLQSTPDHLRVTLGKLDRSGARRSAAGRSAIDLSTATAATVAALIAGEIRKLLYLEEDHPLDEQAPLEELGLDSLMAVELRNILSRRLGLTLSATLLFDYPALAPLAEHLAYDHLGIGANGEFYSDTDDSGQPDSAGDVDIDAVITAILTQIDALPETAQTVLLGKMLEE